MGFLDALISGLSGGFQGYLQGRSFEDLAEERKSRQKDREEREADRKVQLAIQQARLADEGILETGSVDPSERVRHPWKWETQSRYEDLGNGYVRDRTMSKEFAADQKEADARRQVHSNLQSLLGVDPGMDFEKAAGVAQLSRRNPTLFNSVIKGAESRAEEAQTIQDFGSLFPDKDEAWLRAAARNPQVLGNLLRREYPAPRVTVNVQNPQRDLNYAQDLGRMFADAGGFEGAPEQIISHAYQSYLNSPYRKPELDPSVLHAIRAYVNGRRPRGGGNGFDDVLKNVLENGGSISRTPGIVPEQNSGTPFDEQPTPGQARAQPYQMTELDVREARRMVASIPAAQKAEVLKSVGYSDAEIQQILTRR